MTKNHGTMVVHFMPDLWSFISMKFNFKKANIYTLEINRPILKSLKMNGDNQYYFAYKNSVKRTLFSNECVEK